MIKAQLYEKVEIAVDFPATATLCTPSGKKADISSILSLNLDFSYDNDGYESVKKVGERQVFRFFPDEIGIYEITYKNASTKIDVSRGNSKGFVTISKNDPRYFACSDGGFYLPIGINLAFPTVYLTPSGFRYIGIKQYEEWFEKCRQNGVSMARVWIGHEYFCPDTEEAGIFDPIKLSKIDILLDTARKYGIRLKLVLEQFRHFNYERKADSNTYDDDIFRKFNKRLYSNGKRCESCAEWLSNEIWKEAWIKKVGALAARFSGDPIVFGIELWNETDCLPRGLREDWNREMLPAVKALFPKHLVTNSLGSLDSERAKLNYENFCWEASDIKELHRYLDCGAEFDICQHGIIDLIRDGLNLITDSSKPTVLSESGAVNDCHSGPFPYYQIDDDGIIFCDSVYSPLFLGAADCGNIWHWDMRYVEAKNHFSLFKPLADLCCEIDFDKEDFVSEVLENENTILLLLKGKTTSIGYLRNKGFSWETILRDKKQGVKEINANFALQIDGTMEVVKIRDTYDSDLSYNGKELTVKSLIFGTLLKWKKAE